MINELYKLSTTLKENQIRPHVWHDKYGILPSGSCYRIWLCNDGTVNKIESMSKELVAVCRKYGNNQSAFPAFNIAPLYRVTSDEDKALCNALAKGTEQLDIDRLKSVCVNDNWNKKLLAKVNGCLRKGIPAMPEESSIFSLMKITKQIEGKAFRSSLEACLWNCLQSDIKTYLPFLIHKGSEDKQPSDDAGSISIILDIVDWEQFGFPIASEVTTKQINSWLQIDLGNSKTTDNDAFDAFGAPYKNIGKPMPSVRLASGFEVALRSMFREQHCQYRYGNADDGSYPITQDNRSSAKSALEWIRQSDNEGITWRKIGDDAMLFVYPDKLPDIPPKFAGLFSENTKDGKADTEKESRFEAIAQDFIIALNAIEPKNKPENIRIFALQQIPPSLSKRAKVVFTRNLTASGLVNAAREWQEGCRNIPDIYMVEPSIPFPLGISKIANKVWKQDGKHVDGKSAAKLMQYYQGMELLIDTLIPSQLLRIARGIVTNWSGLVLFIGNNIVRQGKKDPLESTHKAEIANLLPLLGLILYKCDVKKEDYMQDTAYLLGQILKASDSLHALYCKVKRDGDIPPQLAGNGVFVTASETPAKALALLSTRMMPYISWAKQYREQGKEKSGLAGWHLQQYEMLMTQLHPKLSGDIRFKEHEKAQLFIGYLAELPKSRNEKSPEQEDTQDEQ